MSEGPKRTDERATIQVGNGEAVEVEVTAPGKVRVTFHGHRGKLAFTAPAGSKITRPVVDIRNQDDLGY